MPAFYSKPILGKVANLALTFGFWVLPHGKLDLRESQAQAELADRLGFDVIWTGEHHFVPYHQAPAPFMQAAHVGTYVKCDVGTAVAVLPYYHPLILAGDVALVDRLLQGRFQFGVGRGSSRYEYERLGMEWETESKPRMLEALDILDTIWKTDDGVSYEGNYYSFAQTYVNPRPLQQPHPPIWFSADQRDSITWGLRRGYNIFHGPQTRPISHISETADHFHDIRAQLGPLGEKLMLAMAQISFSASREKDIERLVREIQYDLLVAQTVRSYPYVLDSRGEVDVPDLPPLSEIRPSDLRGVLPADQLRENLLVGTPEELLRKLERLHLAGVDHIAMRMQMIRVSHDEIMESIRLFGEEVIPQYRERHGIEVKGKLRRVGAG